MGGHGSGRPTSTILPSDWIPTPASGVEPRANDLLTILSPQKVVSEGVIGDDVTDGHVATPLLTPSSPLAVRCWRVAARRLPSDAGAVGDLRQKEVVSPRGPPHHLVGES